MKKLSNSSLMSMKKLKSRIVHSKLLKKHFGDNSIVPSYKIIHSPGNAEVVLNLEENQTVFANPGLMVWMNSTIKSSTETGGLMSGFKRTLGGEGSAFLTTYTGTSNNGSSNKICFSSELPGDIMEIKIHPGEKKLVASGSVVVFTSNVKFDTKFKLQGLFNSADSVFTELSVKADSPSYGVAWLGSFGAIDRLVIKANESYLIDNQHFLQCDSTVNYKIKKVGNLKTKMLSKKELVMEFLGPCEVLIQNKNFKTLAQKVIKSKK